tara:strand:+ start:184 stop:342 length:159 start_codon:yes stop_codon:yes gene_type:complete
MFVRAFALKMGYNSSMLDAGSIDNFPGCALTGLHYPTQETAFPLSHGLVFCP